MNGIHSGTPTRISGAQASECERVFWRWLYFMPTRLQFAAKPIAAHFRLRRRLRGIRHRFATSTGQLAVQISPSKRLNIFPLQARLFGFCALNSKAAKVSAQLHFPFLTISIARTLALCDNLCGCACSSHFTLTGRVAAERPFRQPLRTAHCSTIISCICALLVFFCPWF